MRLLSTVAAVLSCLALATAVSAASSHRVEVDEADVIDELAAYSRLSPLRSKQLRMDSDLQRHIPASRHYIPPFPQNLRDQMCNNSFAVMAPRLHSSQLLGSTSEGEPMRVEFDPPAGYDWPPYGCPWSMIECVHGCFNVSECVELYDNQGIVQWSAVTTCTCEPGWRGVDCSIAESPATCAGMVNLTVFDNVWVNAIQLKHMECFLVNDANNAEFPLQDHHVYLTVDLPNEKANFIMYSRVHQKGNVYGPVIEIIKCDLRQCSGVTQPDNPQYQVYYTCFSANCSACGEDQGCSPYIQVAASLIAPPINAGFYNLQDNSSSASMNLHTNIVIIDLVCTTGQCEHSPPVQNEVGYTSYAWIIVATVATGIASCVGLTCAAFRSNRPRKVLKGMATIDMDQSIFDDHLGAADGESKANGNGNGDGGDGDGEGGFLTMDSHSGANGDEKSQLTAGLLSSAAIPVPTSDAHAFVSGPPVTIASTPDGKPSVRRLSSSTSSVMTTATGAGERGGPVAMRHYAAHNGGAGPGVGGADIKELCLMFRDVTYDITLDDGCCTGRCCCCGHDNLKRILKPTSAIVRSGEVLALMGASGAGKTTLLDILSNTQKVGTVSGKVVLYLDGAQILPRDGQFPDFVAYLSSEDSLLSTQTVYETVQFSARLRTAIPAGITDPESYIHTKVETVLQDLGLLRVADSRVGNAAQGGISSGERKRLMLAVELVTDPLLLFADEPTSGLDSFNANLLMSVLKRHARVRGLAVITSIHQPPANTWHTFDKLLLLTRRGEMAYSGPTADVLKYMTSATREVCPPRANPAEFLLDLASSHKYTTLQDSFRQSPIHASLMASIDAEESNMLRRAFVTTAGSGAPLLLDGGALGGTMIPVRRVGVVKQSLFRQTILLSARSFNHIARDPSLLGLTLFFTLIAAVVLGVVFYQISSNLSGSQDRAGFLFFLVFFFSLLSLNSLNLFLAERRVFVKESSALFYSAGPFLISKILVDIFPLRIIPPLLFGCITYWMIGLQSDPFHFITFLVIVVLVNVTAVSACFAISTFSGSEAKASLLAVVFFVFCMLFGGLFINFHATGAIIQYVKPLRFLSFFHYGYCALMINEFKNLDLLFDPIGGSTAEVNGQTFLNNLSLDTDSFGTDVFALSSMVVLFQGIAFICLKYFQRSSR